MKILGKYRAIVFDFDGVIARTMEDNYRAWKHVLSGFGIIFKKQDYFLIEGLSTLEVARHFLPVDMHDADTLKRVAEMKDRYYLENHNFSFYNGVEELLPKIKARGVKIGLVSGASWGRLQKTVADAFLQLFDVIVTADRSEHCKPHPGPYLKAAETLQIDPEGCLAVENAPAGIESAKSSGMYCIAIASTVKEKHLRKADMIVKEFTELKKVLFSNRAKRINA